MEHRQLLGEVDDETEGVDRILVDRVHRIENEGRAYQQGQQEYFGVVIHILVEGAYALAVHDQNPQALPVMLGLQGLAPDPEALGAGIDRGTDPESRGSLVQNDPVQQK